LAADVVQLDGLMKIGKEDLRPYEKLLEGELQALLRSHLSAAMTAYGGDIGDVAYHCERAYILAELLADKETKVVRSSHA
jgi:hypothetical protein